MPPLLKKIFVAIALLLVGFVLMLYLALRTKVTEISDKPPFSQYINITLDLKRPAAISKTREPDVQANPYLLTEVQTRTSPDAGPRYILPAGTKITIQQAKLFRSGVSGFESAYVLGVVYVPEMKTQVAFEYAWGKNNWSLNKDEKEYYTFALALWQDQPTQGRYRY